MSAVLGLMLVGAGIAIHVEDVRGLDVTESVALTTELARALQARTGTVAVVDDPAWGPCIGADEICLERVRDRTRSSVVVLVRAFAAGTRLRVTMERIGHPGEPRAVDLSRSPVGWRAPVMEAVSSMFAAGVAPPLALAPAPPSARLGPYVVAGVGVAALAVGVVLGVGSASTLADLESGVTTASRAQADGDSARTRAVAANVLFGIAGAAIVAGVVWWLAE